MSRMVLFLARSVEPPPKNAPASGYGLDGGAVTGRVVDADSSGITLQVTTEEFGCQVWHFDYDQFTT